MSPLDFPRTETLVPMFASFGANEMFTSSLLAWALQHTPEVRESFLHLVQAPLDPEEAPRHGATVDALASAPDVEVTVESYAAVGNIDIAMYSRSADALLLIENKTGTALSANQVTKYRNAMAFASPGGSNGRRLGTVVLCPEKDLGAPTGGQAPKSGGATRAAFAKDAGGVRRSAVVSHEALLDAVYRPALAAMGDGRDLGEVLLLAAWRHLKGTAMGPIRDRRADFLGYLQQNIAWANTPYEPARPDTASLRLRPRGPGHVGAKLSIGTSSRSMLTIEFDNRQLHTPNTGSTPDEGSAAAYLQHLEVAKPKGSKTIPVPTPYPVFHHDKPWLTDEESRWSAQGAVVQKLLAGLPGLVAPTAGEVTDVSGNTNP